MRTINMRDGRRLFFTSDTHYSHRNICRGVSSWGTSDTRDFGSLDEMNAAIVDGINGRVGPDDVLFHLGDWSFGGADKVTEFRSRLACREVHLVLGNHDDRIRDRAPLGAFAGVHEAVALRCDVPGRLVLFHYPIDEWWGCHRGNYHLHGHVHSKDPRTGPRRLDVGVDGNGFAPWSLEEVHKTLQGDDFVQHHSRVNPADPGR